MSIRNIVAKTKILAQKTVGGMVILANNENVKACAYGTAWVAFKTAELTVFHHINKKAGLKWYQLGKQWKCQGHALRVGFTDIGHNVQTQHAATVLGLYVLERTVARRLVKGFISHLAGMSMASASKQKKTEVKKAAGPKFTWIDHDHFEVVVSSGRRDVYKVNDAGMFEKVPTSADDLLNAWVNHIVDQATGDSARQFDEILIKHGLKAAG